MRWFPDDETQAVKASRSLNVLCTVHANNFFIVLKNLVWCKSTSTWRNFRNLIAILVLEINISYLVINFISSNPFDLASDFDFLEVICIHTFAQ